MSIWHSVEFDSNERVIAINDVTKANDLRGEGDETCWIDVAFNVSYHPRLRLLVEDERSGQEMVVLLSPRSARLLARRLVAGAEESDKHHAAVTAGRTRR